MVGTRVTQERSTLRSGHARTVRFPHLLQITGRAGKAILPVLLFGSLAAAALQAQGVLTVTPGRGVMTSAGTGTSGYSGDGGAATLSRLARPSGMAYDAAGDLFFADANNHVVREVTAAGVITTVAGTGTAGFGGDGGAATAAFLDTPTGVAIDATGTLYIADSHNHRIRRVSQGTISTFAGTGASGFAGDDGSATAAQLASPSGVALDGQGALYIADTNNQRIRRVMSGTITTVAGNGEELFSGDGAAATAASLDQPTGVAVDAAGNLYIADKNNQRIRVVSAAGFISTLAGNGAGAFAGGFSGDGAAATAGSLAHPVSVAVDSGGNVFVADRNNQRIRQISANGVLSTVLGSGEQGFGGDGGPALGAVLNSPLGVASDVAGNLAIADTRNQRVRSGALGRLSFGTQTVGAVSVSQTVTLANSGTASLTLMAPTLTGPFQMATGGSCSAAPIVLRPGSSCTQNVAFAPVATGQGSGTLAFAGQGVAGQTVLLSGAGVGPSSVATTLALLADKSAALSGEAVTLTATLNVTAGSATGAPGTVSFYAGSQLLGTNAVSQGKATLTTNSLPDGPQTLTAVYSGGTGFNASSSTSFAENVADLNLGALSFEAVSVAPGSSATVPLSLQGTGGTGLSGTVAFTASAVPAGVTVAFSPATTPFANGQMPFSMQITAAPTGTVAAGVGGGSGLAFAVLLLVSVRLRGKARLMRLPQGLALTLFMVAGLGLLGSAVGCGSNTGFFGQRPRSYNITVTATAKDSTGGMLSRNTVVPVTVQ